MNTATLREALAWVRELGPAIELRAGASGAYGEEGARIAARSLLAALDPEELARPALLIWDSRRPGYNYTAGDPLGWIHVFRAPGMLDQAPALFIVYREEGAQALAIPEEGEGKV